MRIVSLYPTRGLPRKLKRIKRVRRKAAKPIVDNNAFWFSEELKDWK